MNFWPKVKKEMNKKLPESYMFLLEESRQLINTALTLSKEQHEKKIQNCKKYVKVSQYVIGGETLHRVL